MESGIWQALCVLLLLLPETAYAQVAETAFVDMFKIYGPMSIGWVIAAYLGNFVLKRYDADIDSRVKQAAADEKMASAMESLAEAIKDKK